MFVLVGCHHKTNWQNGPDSVAKSVVSELTALSVNQGLAQHKASPFLTSSKLFTIELHYQCSMASMHQLVDGKSLYALIS